MAIRESKLNILNPSLPYFKHVVDGSKLNQPPVLEGSRAIASPLRYATTLALAPYVFWRISESLGDNAHPDYLSFRIPEPRIINAGSFIS